MAVVYLDRYLIFSEIVRAGKISFELKSMYDIKL